MDFQFSDFETAHFRAEPRRTIIGDWIVRHLSFAAPLTAHRPPLVFLGGAFQNAWSFLREVRQFLPQRPVIIIELPGQGQNDQLAERLTFADLATLLHEFFDAHSIDRVIPVGLSYGSGIAFSFAQRWPDRIDRLILGGTTERIRPRVEEGLRSTFWYLDHGNIDAFASTAVHHLLNLPLRDSTRVPDRIIEALRAGMVELTDVDCVRYRHNTTRLFTNTLSGHLACRTLVFTARYDHFTAAFEGRELAGRCPSQFVMVDQGDHLTHIEQPKTLLALYDAFLNDKSLDVPGVITGSAAMEACRERRLLQRRPGRRREVYLRRHSGAQSVAALLDYNAHGCLIELADDSLLAERDGPVNVCIPAIGANSDAVLLPDARGARAIFLHDAFGTLGTMPVMTAEMPTSGRRISLPQRLSDLPVEEEGPRLRAVS